MATAEAERLRSGHTRPVEIERSSCHTTTPSRPSPSTVDAKATFEWFGSARWAKSIRPGREVWEVSPEVTLATARLKIRARWRREPTLRWDYGITHSALVRKNFFTMSSPKGSTFLCMISIEFFPPSTCG